MAFLASSPRKDVDSSPITRRFGGLSRFSGLWGKREIRESFVHCLLPVTRCVCFLADPSVMLAASMHRPLPGFCRKLSQKQLSHLVNKQSLLTIVVNHLNPNPQKGYEGFWVIDSPVLFWLFRNVSPENGSRIFRLR